MPYVIVQGDVGGPSQQEVMAAELSKTVASLFQVGEDNVVVVAHPEAGGIVTSAAGRRLALDLEVTVEGAGINEGEIPRVIQEVTAAASRVTGKEPDRIMVLVKVPGGPHMKMTAKCCGIGGKLLS